MRGKLASLIACALTATSIIVVAWTAPPLPAGATDYSAHVLGESPLAYFSMDGATPADGAPTSSTRPAFVSVGLEGDASLGHAGISGGALSIDAVPDYGTPRSGVGVSETPTPIFEDMPWRRIKSASLTYEAWIKTSDQRGGQVILDAESGVYYKPDYGRTNGHTAMTLSLGAGGQLRGRAWLDLGSDGVDLLEVWSTPAPVADGE